MVQITRTKMKLIIDTILQQFYHNCEEGSSQLEFLEANARKHCKVLWVMLTTVILSLLGCFNTPPQEISTVLTATLGPMMLLGGAWFAVSFGGIPAQLLNVAISITFWMFSAFMASLTVAMIAVCFVTSPILWPIWLLIYIATYVACVMYDTADCFKAGLDEAVLTHARYAIASYLEQGVRIDSQD